MRVHVLFFGPVAEALGLREHWLELPSGARIADWLESWCAARESARAVRLGRFYF